MRILYIDIDSLRPDHLGCYGYHRNTSPNIDAIAKSGVRFTNFYATDTPCLPSRTALFGGRFGFASGVVNHGGVWADVSKQGPARSFQNATTLDSLAHRLRSAGLYTASVSSFPHRHSAYQIWHGFRETFDPGRGGLEGAHEVFPYAEQWLQRRGKEDNCYLHVNLREPHTPYDTPLDYPNPFEDVVPPRWLSDEIIARHRASYGPHDAVTPHANTMAGMWVRHAETIRDRESWKAWIDGYDIGIHYADAFVGRLLQVLEEAGVRDETAVIVSADHGENQGELEVYGDHQTADHITNRVPLVVSWPGVTDRVQNSENSGLFYNLDLASTLVELCGGKQPDSWHGRSFADGLRAPSTSGGRESLVLSQGAWACQRSARWGKWLYMKTAHTGWKNFPSRMLFDLEADSHETTNLAEREPGAVLQGEAIIDEWLRQRNVHGEGPDPLEGVLREGGPFHARNPKELSAMCELMRSTGRGEHAAWLEKNGGAPRDDGGSSFAPA